MISTLLCALYYYIIAQVPHVSHAGYGDGCSGRDFSVIWNVPTERCAREWGININVTKYGIYSNHGDGWQGERITIFPTPGRYPEITSNGTVLYGGVPQNTNLSQHIASLKFTVEKSIPKQNFSGIGVLDYEAWRPNWVRNFDAKAVYKTFSMELVRKEHPTWSKEEIEREAKRLFEKSARLFLETTLSTCQKLRPHGKWGYYLYPDCYNHKGEPTCSERTKNLNDRILWLFKQSDMLFPSAYLKDSQNTTVNKNLVHGMETEAQRIQHMMFERGEMKPVYLYSRFRYMDGTYYNLNDLKISIGQAYGLGTEGVILWDDHRLSNNRTMCQSVKNYVDNILGPYVQKLCVK